MQSQNAEITDSVLNQAWEQFGKYVANQIRRGRGVIVPKFGSFTFTAPNFSLLGVTNPKERDFERRIPVFIVSPNFYVGGSLKPAIFNEEFGHIRPFDNKGVAGNMHLIKCNFTEIGILAGTSKDTCQIAVERIIKDLAAKTRVSGQVEMALPGVGVFNVNNGLAGFAFEKGLIGHAIHTTNKHYTSTDRKKVAESYLTNDTMDKFYLSEQGYDVKGYEGRYMSVKPDGKEFLEKKLNISYNSMHDSGANYRPLTASINYDNLSCSYNKSKKRLLSSKPRGRDIFAANPRSASLLTSQRPQTSGAPMTSSNAYFQASTPQAISNPLSMRYKGLMQPTSDKISEERIKSIVKKRIGLWMRDNNLQPIDAFFKIISKELGENVHRMAKYDRDMFSRCLLLLDIGIDEKSAQKYCSEIVDQEGKIDAKSFVANMSDEDRDDLNHIRDIIYQNGLKFEDILKTMDIPKENAELDLFKISKGINRMDPKMLKSKADQIAMKILNGRELISTYDMIEALEGISRGDAKKDIESNQAVLRKIRIKLLDSDNPDMLADEFEKVDEKNDGLLDAANFKTCLLKLKKPLELTIGEINRIARYEPKQKNGTIDYNKFLESLDKEIIDMTLKDANAHNPDSLFSVKELRAQILDYLNRHKLTPLKFLAKLLNNSTNFTDAELKLQRLAVPVEKFKSFFMSNILKDQSVRPETINYYIYKIDVDHDGIIDGQDFEAFLSRHHLIEDTRLRMVNAIQDVTGENYGEKALKNHNMDKFYPVAPLSKGKIDLVLRALRNAIASRNISFREFFTKLDDNKDGMISYDEFAAGMKNIAQFSKETTKRLFAYMDRNQIGLVDFNNFIKVMKKSVLDNLEERAEDNFDWQVDIIKQIQKWYYSANISSEDAFRIVDTDYDQQIGKNDLRIFLQSILFIPAEEVTSVRIDRLFNLIDQYKKGRIGYEDFRRILTEDFRPTDNFSLTGGAPVDKHSFDWKLNARQKMGIYISRKYKSLDNSFEEISHHGARITFEQFNNWIFTHSVLDGFNLTEKLLKDLFSDFDPHKKGHLTRSDWQSVFAHYDHYSIKLNEILDIVSNNFVTSKDAFEYFASFGPSKSIIYKQGFDEAMENLFPGRFNEKDKESIWRMIANGGGSINRQMFTSVFQNVEFTGTLSLSGKTRPTMIRGSASQSYISKSQAIEPDKSDVLSTLRDYLKCTNQNLQQIFEKIDITKCGKVTNLEFKEAIRKLMTGMTSREIDDLINATPMCKDGKIDYKDFIHKMNETETDWRIQDRTRQRLHSIKDLIYIYMLSPKDAFRQYNTDRTGKLTYENFQQMMRQLYAYTGDPLPPFVVLRDLFNFFDKRKDGFIDQREWLETFKRIEVPIKSEHLKHIVLNPNGEAYSNFELSGDFDRVVKAINKNRKYIIDQLSQVEASGRPVDFKTVKKFMGNFLRSQKIAVDSKIWKMLIGFAQRDDEKIDYRYLLDRYRERTSTFDTYPNLHRTSSARPVS